MTPPSSSTCRLCLREGPLRQSHIIPEFCYKGTYDDLHRTTVFNAAKGDRTLIQKGHREALLCADCEQRLCRFEHYFASIWARPGVLPKRIPDRLLVIPGVEYKSYKLFHLSVLWRAHSSESPLFRSVNLGPVAEKIRKRLLNEDPGPPRRYPALGMALFYPEDRRIADDIVIEPTASRAFGQHVYTFVYMGFSWQYFGSSHDLGEDLPCFGEDGDRVVLATGNVATFTPAVEVVRRYKAQAQVRAASRTRR